MREFTSNGNLMSVEEYEVQCEEKCRYNEFVGLFGVEPYSNLWWWQKPFIIWVEPAPEVSKLLVEQLDLLRSLKYRKFPTRAEHLEALDRVNSTLVCMIKSILHFYPKMEMMLEKRGYDKIGDGYCPLAADIHRQIIRDAQAVVAPQTNNVLPFEPRIEAAE